MVRASARGRRGDSRRGPPASPNLRRMMKLTRMLTAASVAAVLALTGAARADTTVELKNTHLCCPACVGAVNKILGGIEGVKGKCDTKAKTITITAKDDAAAQTAIDALAAGGFQGDTGNKDL